MIEKTKLGIAFFDERFGGIFAGRATLCIGSRGSGKTIAALQALLQGPQHNERALMLSSWRAADLAIIASRMGLPLDSALQAQQVMLLEYAHLTPASELEQQHLLPAGSFLKFKQLVETHQIRRVVIDTVLPWVAIRPVERLPIHIYSFIQALDRMGLTSILTIPRPVSPAAHTLRNCLEEHIPIVLTLSRNSTGHYALEVNKYLGEPAQPRPIPFIIAPGDGILRAPKKVSRPPETSPESRPISLANPSEKPGRSGIHYSDAFRTR